ncbi:hypothetical protein OEZ86_004003 [Tetradesmus obliquus]|nr:hypothetical protein OEZ86_004003 [Tetradesmus obliquus]
MVKHDESDFEHVLALPVSTREDAESAGLLRGNHNVSAFDVEFDIEDDELLDLQKHAAQQRSCGCCSCFWRLLPEHLQQPPDCPYCKWSDLYLPKALRPRHYTLHITTDLQEPFLVQGEADIVLQAAELTPCVVLHSKGIDISSAKLLVYSSAEAQQELAEEPVELQGTISPHSSSHHQQVILQFAAALPLPPLQPVLRLAFSYPLTEGLDGFYRSSFIDAANKTKVMASTQFESIAARKAFPCFDEPSFKATFEVKVSAPRPPVVVLSNMPLDHTHSSKASRLISYHFERSPPMSTYLVAWVVGELAHVEMECQLNAELPFSPYAPAKPHGRKLASRAATAADLPGDPPDHHLHSEKLKFTARKLRHEGEDHDEDHDGDHDDDDEDDDEHHAVDVDDGSRGRSIPVRVFGTSDRASQFGLAKEAACHALQTLEELLQVVYPLPKMDLVAIPNFAAGAMENWGLLTYRETALLASDNAPDMKAQYDIATTVAHETAHQWFGDLVTLGDWSELWLNEGFATYFEVVAADAARPSWGYFDGFLETFTSPGLEADGAATSHPLSIGRPVQKLSEIDNWFDDIEYSKGGAVLRMLRAWLNQNDAPMLGLEFGVNTSSSSSSSGGGDSELLQVLPAGEGGAPGVATAGFEGAAGLKALGERDPFIKGLRTYLQELSYGSSNYSTLWRHIAASSGQPVGDMMATWTRRRGFPILSVSLEPSSSSSSGSASNQLLSLNQVPYHAPRTYMVGLPFTPEMYCNDWTDDEADSSWWIPVALQVAGSNAVQWHSFSNCSSNLTLAVPHNGWVLANVGRYGFYRVNYSEPLWAALAAAAPQPATIHSIDLAGLLDDAYSLSLVRQLNVTTFLCLTTALGRRLQPELPPWGIALGWLQRMADVLSSAALLGDAAGGGQWSGCLANLKAFVTQQLTGPFIANLAVPGQAQPGLIFEVNPQDSPELRLLRPKVLTAAGFLGHAGVMAQASQLLRQAAAGQAVLADDVAKAVYSLAVGSGDAAAYDTVQKMYEQALDPTDKDHALRALARVTTAPLITRSLQYALSPAVRTQDVAKLLVDIAKQGGLGFNMTWEFIINHSDDIMKKYGVDDVTYSFGRPLNKLARIFVDEQLIERLKTLEQRQQGLLSPTFIEEANEARMLNADWLRLQGTDACVWLAGALASSSNSSASAAGGGH